MLHEVLLCLSGYPSPLFDATKQDTAGTVVNAEFIRLSAPEIALLKPVGHLASIHRNLKTHAAFISAEHSSAVCRAVATCISAVFLEKFQQKILSVERKILRRDAGSVGAYNIVPLSAVATEFDEWTRRMEYLWDIACFMAPFTQQVQASMSHTTDESCSGAKVIDRLRLDSQTGYPDIEGTAMQLVRSAESAWLRQLTTWILYGKLPAFGASDFFIQRSDKDGLSSSSSVFYIDSKLIPKFVTSRSAASILYIGRSLHNIQSSERDLKGSMPHSDSFSYTTSTAQQIKGLSTLEPPISTAKLSIVLREIRLLLSKNVLQRMLPVSKVLEVLALLNDFFLLNRGEFAVALIREADNRLHNFQHVSTQRKDRPQDLLKGLSIKEGDTAAALHGAWNHLASFDNERDGADEQVDRARDMIHLSVASSPAGRPSTPGRAKDSSLGLPQLSSIHFSDLLFPTPTSLTMNLTSPYDLFLSREEVSTYASINAYLIAIRRAHLHLSDLWKASIRREHPAPLGPPRSSTARGQKLLTQRRQRYEQRSRVMRKFWATCSAGVFMLSEIIAYLEGEVIAGSWDHFNLWICGRTEGLKRSKAAGAEDAISDSETDSFTFASSTRSNVSHPPEAGLIPVEASTTKHDPEALATAHILFLQALGYNLLLTDYPFTRVLRGYLTHIDETVAYMSRLRTIQQSLDLEEDEGIVDALADYHKDERSILLELERARKRVDSDLKALIARLREIDSERIASHAMFSRTGSEDVGFEPWREGGVDRLLMKLDFGRMNMDTTDGEE